MKISYPRSLRGVKIEEYEKKLNEILDKYGFTGSRRRVILEKCLADFRKMQEANEP